MVILWFAVEGELLWMLSRLIKLRFNHSWSSSFSFLRWASKVCQHNSHIWNFTQITPKLHPQWSKIINSNIKIPRFGASSCPTSQRRGKEKHVVPHGQNYRACLLEVAITDTTSASATSASEHHLRRLRMIGIGCRALIWYNFGQEIQFQSLAVRSLDACSICTVYAIVIIITTTMKNK